MTHDRSLNIDVPRNRLVLAYLTRPPRSTRARLHAAVTREEVIPPYAGLGTHPEVVERIWEQLGGSLPRDCSGVVHSCPVLLHPGTGTIFVLALGTGYGLRLPPALLRVATSRGAGLSVRYTNGDERNAHRDLGHDWVLGAWLADEPAWCARAFEYFGRLEDAERESRQ